MLTIPTMRGFPAGSNGPDGAIPESGLLIGVLLQTASSARPGARLPRGLARQAAPRWCSTRTPVTAWPHHTMRPRPVATGRAADVRAVTELLLPARMMIHSGMLSAVRVVILAV